MRVAIDEAQDYLFPSNNPLGIPILNLNYQAPAIIGPIWPWGKVARRRSSAVGTWHFYKDDKVFNALWAHPEYLVNSGCKCMVETNFSIGDEMPPIVALYRIYKKRWLSTFFGINGIGIIVDLNVSARYRKANLLGVPKTWGIYATRAYNGKEEEDIYADYEVAEKRASGAKITFIVYGGGNSVKRLAQKEGWLWIPEEAQRARAEARILRNAKEM